jgi:hypothetical protein
MKEDAMTGKGASNRRGFLKMGAILAAPITAIAAPAAALAEDGSKAKLARLEDERALQELQQSVLREARGAGRGKIARMIEGARENVAAIQPEPDGFSTLVFSRDGKNATARHVCRVEMAEDFTGGSSIEQMAQMQGNMLAARAENRMLETFFARHADGWLVRNVKLA